MTVAKHAEHAECQNMLIHPRTLTMLRRTLYPGHDLNRDNQNNKVAQLEQKCSHFSHSKCSPLLCMNALVPVSRPQLQDAVGKQMQWNFWPIWSFTTPSSASKFRCRCPWNSPLRAKWNQKLLGARSGGRGGCGSLLICALSRHGVVSLVLYIWVKPQ